MKPEAGGAKHVKWPFHHEIQTLHEKSEIIHEISETFHEKLGAVSKIPIAAKLRRHEPSRWSSHQPSHQRWTQTHQSSPLRTPTTSRTTTLGILSCSNLVVITDGNTLLSDEELEWLIVLRMNRDWMIFMREHYKVAAIELFGQTVVGRASA
jgi:hypothetical protein